MLAKTSRQRKLRMLPKLRDLQRRVLRNALVGRLPMLRKSDFPITRLQLGM